MIGLARPGSASDIIARPDFLATPVLFLLGKEMCVKMMRIDVVQNMMKMRDDDR